MSRRVRRGTDAATRHLQAIRSAVATAPLTRSAAEAHGQQRQPRDDQISGAGQESDDLALPKSGGGLVPLKLAEEG
jgi:hypothetical protein